MTGVAPPPVAEQKRLVGAVQSTKPQKGEKWYAIAMDWWREWEGLDKAKDPRSLGRIDNSFVFDEKLQGLKPEVQEAIDYVLQNEKVWVHLNKWYDVTKPISLDVVETDNGELVIDLYPARFQVLVLEDKDKEKEESDEEEVEELKEQESMFVISRYAKMKDLKPGLLQFLKMESKAQMEIFLRPDGDEEWSKMNQKDDEDLAKTLGDTLPKVGISFWQIKVVKIEPPPQIKQPVVVPYDSTKPEVGQQCDAKLIPKPKKNKAKKEKDEDEDNDAKEKKGRDAEIAEATEEAKSGEEGDGSESLPESEEDDESEEEEKEEDEDEEPRWLEAKVVAVDDAAKTVTVHFLSFPVEEDAVFAWDAEEIQPPYSQVADWRTQLRREEDVDVLVKNTWYSGEVRRIDRTGKKLRMKRTSVGYGRGIRQQVGRLFNWTKRESEDGRKDSEETEGTKVAVSDYGLVLITYRSHFSRKEILVDLGSERVAPAYTHTEKPRTRYYGGRMGTKAPEHPGVVGLRNIGNTCFMNSTLQCLNSTRPLTEYFLSGQYTKELNRKNPLGTGGKLAVAYGKLIDEIWSNKYDVVVPSELKRAVGNAFPAFQGYAQQDSHEFLSLFIDGLHEDLNRVLDKPYTEAVESKGRSDEEVAELTWDNFLKRNKSIIVDTMFGLMRSHLTCPECGNEATKFDPYTNWSVPIPAVDRHLVSILYIPLPSNGKRTLTHYVMESKHAITGRDVADWLSERTGVDIKSLALVQTRSVNRIEKVTFSPGLRDATASPIGMFRNTKKTELLAYELDPIRNFEKLIEAAEQKDAEAWAEEQAKAKRMKQRRRIGFAKDKEKEKEKEKEKKKKEDTEEAAEKQKETAEKKESEEEGEKEKGKDKKGAGRKSEKVKKEKSRDKVKLRKSGKDKGKSRRRGKDKEQDDKADGKEVYGQSPSFEKSEGKDKPKATKKEAEEEKEKQDPKESEEEEKEEEERPPRKRETENSAGVWLLQFSFKLQRGMSFKSLRVPDVVRVSRGMTNADVHALLWEHIQHMFDLTKNPYEAVEEVEEEEKKEVEKEDDEEEDDEDEEKVKDGENKEGDSDKEEVKGKVEKKASTGSKESTLTNVSSTPGKDKHLVKGDEKTDHVVAKGKVKPNKKRESNQKEKEGKEAKRPRKEKSRDKVWRGKGRKLKSKKRGKEVAEEEAEGPQLTEGEKIQIAYEREKQKEAKSEEGRVQYGEDKARDDEAEEKVVSGGSKTKVVPGSSLKASKPTVKKKRNVGPPPEEVKPSDLFFITHNGYRKFYANDKEFTPTARYDANKLDVEISPVGIDYLAEGFNGVPPSRYFASTPDELHEMVNMGVVEKDESFRLLEPTKDDAISLDKCLNKFSVAEVLGKEDEWYCNKCKQFVQATKKMDIWNSADILCIHLKRFKGQGWRREKLDDFVSFPFDLDISEYVLSDQKENQYELYAVSNHMGGLGGGHYTADVKNENGWFYMNDSSARKESDKGVVSAKAYVLFYQRKKGGASSGLKGGNDVQIVCKTPAGEI